MVTKKSGQTTVTVNGVKYYAKRPVQSVKGEHMRIIIVDGSGLTFVGRCSLEGDGDRILIRDARCVVRWGTKNHLAELVGGPSKETVLGAMADVEVFRPNLVASYIVDEGAWNV